MYKQHHSLADGISQMCLHMAMSDEYNTSKMLPIKEVPWISRMLLRILTPLYILKIVIDTLKKKIDHNLLHDGIRNLSGKKVSAAGKDFLVADIKKTSKVLKMTINDMITSCIGTAIK